MRLTTYSDYALRVLMYLALKGEDLATIGEIAGRYDISKNHLMKVVQELGHLGLVETVRGKGGGLRLAKRPEDIGVGEVIRATEEGFALVECFDAARNECLIDGACGLKGALHEALQAFLAVLDDYSLADFLKRPAALRQRLHLPIVKDQGEARI